MDTVTVQVTMLGLVSGSSAVVEMAVVSRGSVVPVRPKREVAVSIDPRNEGRGTGKQGTENGT